MPSVRRCRPRPPTARQDSHGVEAVIDTGFTGFPTVTPALAGELGLDLPGTSRATLADGSEVTFPSYSVAVLWDGQASYVEADAAETTPLVGMRLLDGHSLYIELEDGGRGVIEPTATGGTAPRRWYCLPSS